MNRFQQIINAIHRKGTNSIFVVSSSKDNHTIGPRLFNQHKRIAICQLNVQKQEFRMGICAKPFNGFFNSTG